MKPIILVLLVLSGLGATGQTPAEIEQQLLGPWERVHYWGSHFSFADSTIDRTDSLDKADSVLHETFAQAINSCPACLTYDFPFLRDSGLVITSSADGKFRAYVWDNEAGGSMRYFDHVFQYQVGNKIKATMLKGTSEDNEIGWFVLICPFRAATATYYLTFSRSAISGSGRVETATAFRIGKDSLIGPIKLFRKDGRPEDQVGIEFMDFRFRITKGQKLHALVYDGVHQTIKIPHLDEIYGNPTGQYTPYRWNGRYFVAK
jgi:hypothetical protein